MSYTDDFISKFNQIKISFLFHQQIPKFQNPTFLFSKINPDWKQYTLERQCNTGISMSLINAHSASRDRILTSAYQFTPVEFSVQLFPKNVDLQLSSLRITKKKKKT